MELRLNEETGKFEKYIPYCVIEVDTEEDYKKLQEAAEKQEKKRPKETEEPLIYGDGVERKPEGTKIIFSCQACGNTVGIKYNDSGIMGKTNYCPECGQKLDWGTER